MLDRRGKPLKIAVVGTGISGMAAAWLLSRSHEVTVFERDDRIGGHSNTVDVAAGDTTIPVDTGFIVYNEAAYPNLAALFKHLDVPTRPSEMSFAASLREGTLEYSGTDLAGLFAQRRNILSPRFWRMLADIRRFYREAPHEAESLDESLTLGGYLATRGYGEPFRDDHLLPMAGAIWSATPDTMLDYPAAAFIRFHQNHGLLQVSNRPQWRTVVGGSRTYVEKLTKAYARNIKVGLSADRIRRRDGSVEVRDSEGRIELFDHIVIAAHADQALAMLDDASAAERTLLGAFRYSENVAVLHSDPSLMPRRRAAWSSWNYIGPSTRADVSAGCAVTYWMNCLQNFESPQPLFVTLNPQSAPDPAQFIQLEIYEHPVFDTAAMRAQRHLWSLQGRRNTWFCGAYFGSGFHEDGLQAGLAVAEALGGGRRPWRVANESGRIFIGENRGTPTPSECAA